MVAGTVLFPPSVHRSLSMCDGLLFDLIRSWFEFLTVCQARYHAHHAAESFFAFDLFPLYYLQIHALLPSVHHSILQQLSCGLARRQGQPTPTEYIKSGMKARWPQGLEFTRSCFLLSSPNWATQLVEMILCHCNVFVVTDVNICRGSPVFAHIVGFKYLDLWMDALRNPPFPSIPTPSLRTIVEELEKCVSRDTNTTTKNEAISHLLSKSGRWREL